MADDSRPEATPGCKMQYLITRRAGTSREELVAHWYANHMPAVIAGQKAQADSGRAHATRYLVTLYEADRAGEYPFDGVAQLWWERPLPMPQVPHGTTPTDTFQQKVEPYVPWATTEYVVIDGSDRLDSAPLTLNAPYPTTRSGFLKVSFLVTARADPEVTALFDHWLDVHVPNMRLLMAEVGGFRYVVNHSLDPASAPFVGMAELYFPDAGAWQRFAGGLEPDGMEAWVERSLVLTTTTQMVGIP